MIYAEENGASFVLFPGEPELTMGADGVLMAEVPIDVEVLEVRDDA